MTDKIYAALISEMPAGLDRAILRVLSFHIGKKKTIGRESLWPVIRMEGLVRCQRAPDAPGHP